MAIMNNDRRSFGARERDDESAGRDERPGGGHDRANDDRYEGGRYEGGQYEGRSDRRFGSDYGAHHGRGEHGGGYPQRGDAMSMGAGLGRGSDMTGKGPKGYTRSDDRIREDVCDCLTDDRHVDASSIEVQVRNGEVTLSGTVDGRGAKRHAEDLVEHASGVKHVQNNLQVQTGSDAGSDASERTGTGHTTSSIIT